MADTLTDITLNADTFTDIYTATSIVVGTAINIHNKGATEITIVIQAAQPTVPANKGVVVPPFSDLPIPAGQTGCWGVSSRGTCKVSVA